MSSEGLPVNNVVGTSVDLGARSVQDAANSASSSQNADSAAASADAAWKFSRVAQGAAGDSAAAVSEAEAAAAIAAEAAKNAATSANIFPPPAQAVIDAGTIPLNALFNVGVPAGATPPRLADQYKNVDGVATLTGQTVVSGGMVDVVIESVNDLNGLITEANLVYPDIVGAVTDELGNATVIYKGTGETLIPILGAGDQLTAKGEAPGYQSVTVDSLGNMPLGIKNDGTVHAPKLEVGTSAINYKDIPGYEYVLVSSAGDMPFGIASDGTAKIPIIESASIRTELKDIPGFAYAITDPDGNVAFGIKSDGKVIFYADDASDSNNAFGVSDSDAIAIIGDSYTDSLFTLKDKAYICDLSALSDYRFCNYGVSGFTALALNKRLVDNTAWWDGSTFKSMNAKYAIIMTWTNDSAHFVNHGMVYYMYNIERLIDSVMAYGAVPIVVAEWIAPAQAVAQLRAVCNVRGIQFIDNSNLQKEVGNLVVGPLNQGHPGTRTNAVIWASLYDQLKRLPRPRQSIKVYRQRPGIAVGSDADVLYSGSVDRSTKWKEITVPHRSLLAGDEKYFEELDGRGDVRAWQVQADEYRLLGAAGVDFTDRLLITLTYPGTAIGLTEVGFTLNITGGEVFVRKILDVASAPGVAGEVQPGIIIVDGVEQLSPDYLSKYNKPRGSWVRVGSGTGDYTFTDNLQNVMFGDQIQIMIKAATGKLIDVRGFYKLSKEKVIPAADPTLRTQSTLVSETFESFSSWSSSGVTSIVPIDVINTPRNLAYSGPLSQVAVMAANGSLKKTVTIASLPNCDITEPVLLQVELWARYFPKVYLDNSIYHLDASQIIDSSQPGNTFPAASLITSDTCDLKKVTLQYSLGGSMTMSSTIEQSDFACLYWRPLKFLIQVSAYTLISQITLNITTQFDDIQLAKIYIKEVK